MTPREVGPRIWLEAQGKVDTAAAIISERKTIGWARSGLCIVYSCQLKPIYLLGAGGIKNEKIGDFVQLSAKVLVLYTAERHKSLTSPLKDLQTGSRFESPSRSEERRAALKKRKIGREGRGLCIVVRRVLVSCADAVTGDRSCPAQEQG